MACALTMATRRLISFVALWTLIFSAGTALAKPGRVAALSEIRVNDRVEGDVVALGGDAQRLPTCNQRKCQ